MTERHHNGLRAMLWPTLAAAITATVLGCGSSSSSSPGSGSPSSSAGGSTTSSTAGASNPNQRETLPPGDIPDTIAFVPYPVPGTGVTISTPEGWSRSRRGGTVTFTDKLNQIQLSATRAGGPVTVSSAQHDEIPRIAASVKMFRLESVSTVTRPAGQAVRIAYLGDSPPNPVTGKIGTLAFERYDFFHAGRRVILLLSSPRGSDNVDPWKKVTSSLRFSR